MTDNPENKVKIRFKFRSGEEFEAEGNLAFIEKQRADFLQLIGKDAAHTKRVPIQQNITDEGPAENVQGTPSFVPQMNILRAPSTVEPAFFRRKHDPGTAPTPSAPRMSVGISAAENARLHPQPNEQELRLWEQITRTDDKHVYLRRKSRQLSPDTAALVLIAAAKVLLQATQGYSALALAKSLKKSGYGGDRLDRVLGGELKKGTVRSEGTKRSRLYLLSDEGFARAYVLATKLAEEWHF